jgi:hypothetical protein
MMKRCPFCGNIPKASLVGSTLVHIACANDRCHVRPSVCSQTIERVLLEWNYRAPAN